MMADDNGSPQLPKINYKNLTSSIFCSPRLFTGFVSKSSNETEPNMSSPTSILDTKPFFAPINPFCSDPKTPKSPKQENKNLWDKFDSKGLANALIDEKSDSTLLKLDKPMVLFGSQLKIQVPPLPNSESSPKSPRDFGIKTRSSHVGSFSPGLSSPSPSKKSPFGSSSLSSLSVSEMELSEDYTCVISYGPNPKTTHIFDDCIVESCCGVVKFTESRKENGFSSDRAMSYPSESFLSFCYGCKKNLGQGNDIYMYRGEKAFCSSECRYEEMMLEDEGGLETSQSDVNNVSL